MVKAIDLTQPWIIYDIARNQYNEVSNKLQANSDSVENGTAVGNANQNNFNFLSNGFSVAASNDAINTGGAIYIFCAFAADPFKYANAH